MSCKSFVFALSVQFSAWFFLELLLSCTLTSLVRMLRLLCVMLNSRIWLPFWYIFFFWMFRKSVGYSITSTLCCPFERWSYFGECFLGILVEFDLSHQSVLQTEVLPLPFLARTQTFDEFDLLALHFGFELHVLFRDGYFIVEGVAWLWFVIFVRNVVHDHHMAARHLVAVSVPCILRTPVEVDVHDVLALDFRHHLGPLDVQITVRNRIGSLILVTIKWIFYTRNDDLLFHQIYLWFGRTLLESLI